MNKWKTWMLWAFVLSSALICTRCASASQPGKKAQPPNNAGPTATDGTVAQGQDGSKANGIGAVNDNVSSNNSTAGIMPTGAAQPAGSGTLPTGTQGNAMDGVAAFIGQMFGGGNASTTGATIDTGTGCIEGDDFTCQVEVALVKYTNDIRARNGRGALTQDYHLSYVARDWSIKQGAMISHTGFPEARVTLFQQKFPNISVPEIEAENVAMNASGGDADSVAKMFADQWEHSPGHFANIIGGYRYIGAGISCPGHKSSASAASQPANNSGDLASMLGSLFGGLVPRLKIVEAYLTC